MSASHVTARLGLLVAGAGVVGLLAGCGGTEKTPTVASAQKTGSSSHAEAGQGDGNGKAHTQEVLEEYIAQMQTRVDCLRENGLPDLPDPNEFGQIIIDQRKITDPDAIDEALDACKDVGNIPMPPEVHELVDEADAESLTEEQKQMYADYAQCMQENGAPDFPDPEPNGMAGEGEWDPLASGAKEAAAECAPIIGDPVNQGPGVG